ncbi:formate dehydrogenase accessory protein FdhE [Bacillus marasmi]|uniref:formate dehydrogenase accessory protein FdhE n=1 Tax=Bacillus marasmi TaxID=1926279 RepID=UPI0011C92761|nr:formate dehydrogenase accessory protein FdhE [Bacillus marasmi]
MKTSVVSKEYLNLQKEIIQLQEQWKKGLNPDSVRPNYDQAVMETGVPIAAFTAIDFDIALFVQWIDELKDVLLKNNPQLSEQFDKLAKLLDEQTAVLWLEEAYALNHIYFQEYANQHGLEPWLPQFLAETALRPYLQLIAEKVQPRINAAEKGVAVPGCGCPVCGEPVRLGQLEGKGQKVLHCPRCLAYWLDKKISCSHCGNTDHGTIQFLTIEGDSSSQIHVCDKCKGYTKVIDTRQHLEKPSTTLLDLKTIHLDYIAQEKGYSSTGNQPEGDKTN